MAELTKMKTYVLLEHLEPTAPIYIRVSPEKRVRISKIPKLDLYLKYTFPDENNYIKTIRLKLNSNTVDQAEQIKLGVLANEPFTDSERKATRFINGVLTTNSKVVQDFLDIIPDNEKFKGARTEDFRLPLFKEYNQEKISEQANESFKRNLAAANKINDLSLAAAQEMLWKIHGTHYKVPDTLYAAQNALVDYMDSHDAAVEDILKTGLTIDEEVVITIGKLISADVISFDALPGQVAKKKNDQWIGVKSVSADLDFEERKRYFMEYLTTPNGLTLLADLKNDVNNIFGENQQPRLDEDLVSSKGTGKTGENITQPLAATRDNLKDEIEPGRFASKSKPSVKIE